MPDNSISEQTLKKFSDLFRFWVKRIEDGQEDSIAPGELCIKPLQPDGAVIYWRDPITGELITPNTLEDLQIILDHFNKEDGTFSADLIGGMRFYTNIYDLKLDAGVNYTPDTIISHMVDKSIMVSVVEFPDDYAVVGWPTGSGLVTITKMSNDTVRAEYTDRETSNTWTGVYNANTHEFIRWQFSEDVNSDYIDAVGDEYKLRADSDKPVYDFEVWNVKVPCNVQTNATLQINDSEYLPIKTVTGTDLSEIISANSVIMITYDSYRKCWVNLSSDRSIASQLMQIMSIRLDGQTGDLTTLLTEVRNFIEDTSDVIGAIQDRLTKLETNPARIVYTCDLVPITSENTKVISLDSSVDPTLDIVIVNFEQTILQLGVDYTINIAANAIEMATGSEFTVGDEVQIIVVKQPKT